MLTYTSVLPAIISRVRTVLLTNNEMLGCLLLVVAETRTRYRNKVQPRSTRERKVQTSLGRVSLSKGTTSQVAHLTAVLSKLWTKEHTTD